MIKRLVHLLILVSIATAARAVSVPCPGGASNCWAYVQDATGLGCGLSTSCNTLRTNNGTMIATVTGNLLVIQNATGNNTHITSVTDSASNTWTLCAASACNTFNSTIGLAYDLAYCIACSSTNSITVNINATPTGFFAPRLIEIQPPTGTVAFDASAVQNNTTNSTSATGPNLGTLAGTDFIYSTYGNNATNGPNGWNTIVGPSGSPWTIDLQNNLMCFNCTGGGAFTLTQSSSANSLFSAIAFKTTTSFSAPSTPISIRNLDYTGQISCNCTVTLTNDQGNTFSTQNGDLVYIQQTGPNNDKITSVSDSGGSTWVVDASCQILHTGGHSLSCAYTLKAKSSSSITVNMNGTPDNATFLLIYDMTSSAGGTWVKDAIGNQSNAASNAPAGVTLTLTGTSEVVFQALDSPGGASSVNWYSLAGGPSGSGAGAWYIEVNNVQSVILMNTTLGTGPTWSFNIGSATVATGAAFSNITTSQTGIGKRRKLDKLDL